MSLLEQFPVRREWHAGAATGIGSLPGSSPGEGAAMVAGELPDLPHLVELPDRGVGADLVGRTAGLLVDIWAEVVPSGWRIARRPGRDTMRAKDLMAWDLDAAQEHYAGADWVKVQVCGPWTLAAGLEVASGHRALTDPGAVDDLAQSLIEGLAAHLSQVSRRLPGTGVVVQIDEPSLPAVLVGNLPTASGFGTVGAVPAARAQELLTAVVESVGDRPTVAHCCHGAAPMRLLRSCGFDALAVDLTIVGECPAALDAIGEVVDGGGILLAGMIPSTGPVRTDRPLRHWAAPLLDVWNRLGLPGRCGRCGCAPNWPGRCGTCPRVGEPQRGLLRNSWATRAATSARLGRQPS